MGCGGMTSELRWVLEGRWETAGIGTRQSMHLGPSLLHAVGPRTWGSLLFNTPIYGPTHAIDYGHLRDLLHAIHARGHDLFEL